MSRTFLALCQDVVSDLGVAGGILQSTASGINQEQARICNWVARADLLIQNLWSDWNFLWVQGSGMQVLAGQNTLTITPPTWAANVQSVNEQTLWYQPATNNAQRIPWMPWEDFYTSFMSQPLQTAACPSSFSVDPTNTIWFSQALTANALFGLQYWVVGKRLSGDTSTSPIPNNFDDLIVERAKILYAQRENAPEILTGSSAEYADLLDKMQAYCLPRNRAGRTSQNNRTTVPPAYVE